VFRYKSPLTGKERYMGLGPAPAANTDKIREGLADARERADNARKLLRDGIDPLEARKTERAAAKVEASRSITFKAYAEQYISGKEAGWKNEKHRQQWRNSLRDYVYPHIGSLPIAAVDTDAVLKVLRPIWAVKKETARRVRGRIEMILNAAKPKSCALARTRRYGAAIWIKWGSPVAASQRSNTILPCPMKKCRNSGNRWPVTRATQRECCAGSS
jgi:integrase